MCVNRQFQAKTAKYRNYNILDESDQDEIWGPTSDQQLNFVGGLMLSRSNPIWLPAAILKKSIWRHNFAADRPILTKFDTLMQNDLPMTINKSKSKPEAQFQYGGRPFSETESSFTLAVDWDISSKFGKANVYTPS